MMKDFTIEKLLDLKEQWLQSFLREKRIPGKYLPEIKDFILKLGKTLDPDEYEYREGDIWIAKICKDRSYCLH